mgnify:CR=1 FL=1
MDTVLMELLKSTPIAAIFLIFLIYQDKQGSKREKDISSVIARNTRVSMMLTWALGAWLERARGCPAVSFNPEDRKDLAVFPLINCPQCHEKMALDAEWLEAGIQTCKKCSTAFRVNGDWKAEPVNPTNVS